MSADRKDPLEEMLMTRDPYIDDEGFSQRVLQALPPARPPRRVRLWILLGCGVLGCVCALVLSPGAHYIAEAVMDIAKYNPFGGEIPLLSVALVVMVIWAGVMAIGSET